MNAFQAGARRLAYGPPDTSLAGRMGPSRLVPRAGTLGAVGLLIVLLAAAFPATPPTVGDIVSSTGSLWTRRIGPGNVFELLLAGLAVAWFARSLVASLPRSTFDSVLLAAVLGLTALQVLAICLDLGTAQYLRLDIERLVLPAAGYLVVTRSIDGEHALRTFVIALAAVITLRSLQLVLVYGITGKTQFGTITGGQALLITEDTLLLLLPLVLSWGALIDGKLALGGMAGALAILTFVGVIDLLSLRRGAMILIVAAIAVRSVGIGRRRLLQCVAVVLLAFAVLVAAGPGRSTFDRIRYTVESSTLKTKDASSQQRTSELKSFVDNMHGLRWVTGAGLGVSWRALERAPVDQLSFGTGETALQRIGWHVYGLDWAYKFGLAGLGVLLWAGLALYRRLSAHLRLAKPELRALLFSVGVCVPPFMLLMFTNLRVGLLAGVTIGVLSKGCDVIGAQTRTMPMPGASNVADSARIRSS